MSASVIPFKTVPVVLSLVLVRLSFTQREGLSGSRLDLNPRPIWNIAHMVNNIDLVYDFLEDGANSIEFDVRFDKRGIALYTYHGFPCDCFRGCGKTQKIDVFLEHLRSITTPGDPLFNERLVLLFFDLKLSDLSENARCTAGLDLANRLVEHYWLKGNGTAQAYMVLSLPSVTYSNFLICFYSRIREEEDLDYMQKTGIDFSGNEKLTDIRDVIYDLNIPVNVWGGDGVTNCLYRDTTRLRELLSNRDSPEGFLDKVYWWTVDRKTTMETVLRLGVDGIMTNHPERVISVLDEDEFLLDFRLATIEDNPFERFSLSKHDLRYSGDTRTSTSDSIPAPEVPLPNS